MSHPRTIVTGASGFVGRHLIERLQAERRPVTVLVRPGSRIPTTWARPTEVLPLETFDMARLKAAFDVGPVDTVFHLAAYGVQARDRDVEAMTEINVDLFARLARLAADAGAVLVSTGTNSEYAAGAATALDEDAPLDTTKLYGASKAAGALIARAITHAFQGKLRHLRLFNVYGPGEGAQRLLPALLTGIKSGRRIPLSAGDQVRDFVFVDDVVDALLAAERHALMPGAAPVEVYNVATGVGTSVRDFARAVAHAAAAPPELLGFGDLPLRPDDIPYLVGNPTRAWRDLNWRAAHNLQTGLLRAVTEAKAEEVLIDG
jgi:nucleoside-diphosphate-sugar epimerase